MISSEIKAKKSPLDRNKVQEAQSGTAPHAHAARDMDAKDFITRAQAPAEIDLG